MQRLQVDFHINRDVAFNLIRYKPNKSTSFRFSIQHHQRDKLYETRCDRFSPIGLCVSALLDAVSEDGSCISDRVLPLCPASAY